MGSVSRSGRRHSPAIRFDTMACPPSRFGLVLRLDGGADLEIGDYALVSDCRTAALISRTGSVDWLCPGRFDHPSIFARLLDETAGHWSLRPSGDSEVSRRYVEGTMVLETTFQTASGTLVLLDAFALGANEKGHGLG